MTIYIILLDMISKIIGRKDEKNILGKLFNSKKAEFVAVCGRRRVGKTFLIKEYFENDLIFKTSGLAHSNMKYQLKAFYDDLLDAGLPKQDKTPSDWIEAFSLLRQFIRMSEHKRKVVFLDELPWFDTPKSGFVAALEHFWNVWGSTQDDLLLVVCGSATSWMMDKLINNHGGLHNRLTCKIFLRQFSLSECEELLQQKGFNASRYDMAVLYMVLGGIPYYLERLDAGMSLSQNIDELVFRKNGALYDEFSNLYASLFKNSYEYIKVVEALSAIRMGLSRKKIIEMTKLQSGNGLTTILKNLESCDFIRKYRHYEKGGKKINKYQLTDFFTIFYFHFLHNKPTAKWERVIGTSDFFAWAGITFELLVLSHIGRLKECLGISGVQTDEYTWSCHDDERGAQIDLLIDRKDLTVNLCEIKFSMSEFTIDKDYEAVLRNKVAKFVEYTKHQKSVIPTFISTYGLNHNSHSGIIAKEIRLDEFFSR